MILLFIIGGLIAVLATMAWIASRKESRDAGAQGFSRTRGVNTGDRFAVEALVAFARSGRSSRTTTSDPQFIADGLRALAGALATIGLAPGGLDVDLRVAAEHVLLDPSSLANAKITRDHLVAVADTFGAQGLDNGASLRRLAEAVTPDQPLPAQTTTIADFLRATADILARDVSRAAGPQAVGGLPRGDAAAAATGS
jgi:hypothetical protein